MRDKDREKVKGIFRFYEVPGGGISFVYRAYKGDPIERYDLIDGQVYTLPLGVAKHLNKNGWYPQYEYVSGDTSMLAANPVQGFGSTMQNMRVGKKVRRFGFQSLEFVDVEELSTPDKEVISVEYTNPAE